MRLRVNRQPVVEGLAALAAFTVTSTVSVLVRSGPAQGRIQRGGGGGGGGHGGQLTDPPSATA